MPLWRKQDGGTIGWLKQTWEAVVGGTTTSFPSCQWAVRLAQTCSVAVCFRCFLINVIFNMIVLLENCGGLKKNVSLCPLYHGRYNTKNKKKTLSLLSSGPQQLFECSKGVIVHFIKATCRQYFIYFRCFSKQDSAINLASLITEYLKAELTAFCRTIGLHIYIESIDNGSERMYYSIKNSSH